MPAAFAVLLTIPPCTSCSLKGTSWTEAFFPPSFVVAREYSSKELPFSAGVFPFRVSSLLLSAFCLLWSYVIINGLPPPIAFNVYWQILGIFFEVQIRGRSLDHERYHLAGHFERQGCYPLHHKSFGDSLALHSHLISNRTTNSNPFNVCKTKAL